MKFEMAKFKIILNGSEKEYVVESPDLSLRDFVAQEKLFAKEIHVYSEVDKTWLVGWTKNNGYFVDSMWPANKYNPCTPIDFGGFYT